MYPLIISRKFFKFTYLRKSQIFSLTPQIHIQIVIKKVILHNIVGKSLGVHYAKEFAYFVETCLASNILPSR